MNINANFLIDLEQTKGEKNKNSSMEKYGRTKSDVKGNIWWHYNTKKNLSIKEDVLLKIVTKGLWIRNLQQWQNKRRENKDKIGELLNKSRWGRAAQFLLINVYFFPCCYIFLFTLMENALYSKFLVSCFCSYEKNI